MSYQSALREHLASYASKKLGVSEEGKFRGKSYPHILPIELEYLNILEPIRAEVQCYLKNNRNIKLHQCFHHLNSSQAFAFNLFYPYFSKNGLSANILSGALGFKTSVVNWWKFEWIPDPIENTNVDFAWNTSEQITVYCEVKLSEAEFGTARCDERHQRKLAEIYRPRLKNLVSKELLEEKTFFNHYQLLRNVSFLTDQNSHLVLLMPRENKALNPQLTTVMAGLNPNTRERVHIAYIEDVIKELKSEQTLLPELQTYASYLWEKYVPDIL